jgi:HTH-type transcriptional regulator/antitoxin HipB
LQTARKSAGLSQTALAQRLGISQSRVSAMELDPGSISVEQLLALLAALNHEVLVQPKQGVAVERGGDDDAATPDWYADPAELSFLGILVAPLDWLVLSKTLPTYRLRRGFLMPLYYGVSQPVLGRERLIRGGSRQTSPLPRKNYGYNWYLTITR